MSELAQLGAKLFHARADARPKIVPTTKRVRGLLNGSYIFDTTAAKLVWENKYFPYYWIPQKDIVDSVATITPDRAISGIQSSTSRLEVKGHSGAKSISILLCPISFSSELAGYVKFRHEDLDAWFEELSEVRFHPKDPFHRVDVMPSGRHVKVEMEGTVLADTGREGGVMGLWETNLPERWYLPRTAVNWGLLRSSKTETGCPYKGKANYYDAVIEGKEYQDVAWWYENPTAESGSIRGMLCFYPDKVDTLVDGKPIEKVGMPKVKQDTQEEEHNHGYTSCNC